MESKILVEFDGGARRDELTPIEGVQAGPSLADIAEALRSRRDPGDWGFDRFMPHSWRVVSDQFWTPLVVAMRAAEWFEEFGIRTVVDIGSGAGKFCVAAALAGNCKFVGVEQRPRLVFAARNLAGLFQVEGRVHFLHSTFGEEAPPNADAYYLYNPFGENLFGPGDRLGGNVDLGDERYSRDVEAVEQFLERAKEGTFVVTYNGFGGRLPESFTELRVDRELPNALRISRKVR